MKIIKIVLVTLVLILIWGIFDFYMNPDGFIDENEKSWIIEEKIDQMTGEKNYIAFSDDAYPNVSLGSIFNKTKAYIGVSYENKEGIVYIIFNNEPKLMNNITMPLLTKHLGEDTYFYRARVRFDDEVWEVPFTKKRGSSIIRFIDNKFIINKINKANDMMLELNWNNEKTVYFKFSLKGSSVAINSIKN